MFIYIFIAVIVTVWILLVRDINRVSETKDEEYDIDDPTTTCWDDDRNHTEGDFH
jgi:hypothetical protein